MAYTLLELRTLARQRADMDPSDFVTDTEVTQYLNDSVKELFELLVVTYGQEYFYDASTATTVADTQSYAMPSDAFKLLRVDVKTQYGYEPLRPWKFPASILGMPTPSVRRPGRLPRYRWTGANLVFEPTPPGVHEFRVHYVPRPARMVDDTDELGRPLDDWAEYVVLGAAIKCLMKQESDTSGLVGERTALRQHITMTAPPKDAGYPQTVVDDRCRDEDADCCDLGGWTAALTVDAIDPESEEELDLAKIRSTATTNIPNTGADTAITLTTQEFQKGTTVAANPSSNNITVTVAGYYAITWGVHWDNFASGGASDLLTCTPTINGVATLSGSPLNAIVHKIIGGTGNQATGKTLHLQLAAGSVIALIATNTTNTNPVAVAAYLTVVKLATT